MGKPGADPSFASSSIVFISGPIAFEHDICDVADDKSSVLVSLAQAWPQ